MLKLNDTLIEYLKWFALIVMTADHINKFIFHEKYVAVFYLGRLVMPLFAFILAYNLSRQGALERGAYGRTMGRLIGFGALATPFLMLSDQMSWGWYPLNIMFLLFTGVAVAYYQEKGDNMSIAKATAIFLVGGALSEFWWFGLSVFLFSKRYAKNPSMENLLWLVLSTASLYFVNNNLWGLLATAIILLAIKISKEGRMNLPPLRRNRNVFYEYYPAHLAVIIATSILFKT